jgi:hypothetical protein
MLSALQRLRGRRGVKRTVSLSALARRRTRISVSFEREPGLVVGTRLLHRSASCPNIRAAANVSGNRGVST